MTDATAAVVPTTTLTEQKIVASETTMERIIAFTESKQQERSRMVRGAAIQIAATQWGAALSKDAQGAIARWALEAGIDPVRHIYVLGGRIYDNAELYIDYLASMDEFLYDELVLMAPLENRDVSELPLGEGEKKKLLREMQVMNYHRMQLQIQYGVPPEINQFPETSAAALTRLFFRDQPDPVLGWNWAGSFGRTHKKPPQNPVDPIGDKNPVKTAITRSLRRAAKKKCPVWFKKGSFGQAMERAERLIELGREDLKVHGVESAYSEPVSIGGGLTIKAPVTSGSCRVPEDGAYGLETEPTEPKPVVATQPAEDPYTEAQAVEEACREQQDEARMAQLTDDEIRQHDVELAHEDGDA